MSKNIYDTRTIRVHNIFYLSYWNGGFWFRFFGHYGMHGKDRTKNMELFSERNGFAKRLVIGKWAFRLLRREKIYPK